MATLEIETDNGEGIGCGEVQEPISVDSLLVKSVVYNGLEPVKTGPGSGLGGVYENAFGGIEEDLESREGRRGGN